MQTSPFLNEQPRRRLTGLAMRAGVSALAPPGAVHIDVLDREASPRGLYQIRRSVARRPAMSRVQVSTCFGDGRHGVAGGEPELADRLAGGPGVERGQV
jgi:hypothetical protein